MSDDETEVCPDCNGDKRFATHSCDINGRMMWKSEDCLLCAGHGTVHPSLAAKYREVKRLKETTS